MRERERLEGSKLEYFFDKTKSSSWKVWGHFESPRAFARLKSSLEIIQKCIQTFQTYLQYDRNHLESLFVATQTPFAAYFVGPTKQMLTETVTVFIYSESRLMLMLSAAYCNRFSKAPFTKDHKIKNNWLMLSFG